MCDVKWNKSLKTSFQTLKGCYVFIEKILKIPFKYFSIKKGFSKHLDSVV